VNEPLANYAITAASVSDSATRLARTREIAMALALEMPTLSPEEQGVARENLEDARRQLFRLESRSALWRSERCRSRFVRIAVSSRYRKRHRAEALLATLFPSAARSQMKGDPDLVERA
jgi:hypothetical protein